MTANAPSDGTTNKKWGIMVYMAADNDLSQEAIYAIGKIQESFKSREEMLRDVEFFLYFDGDAFGFPSLQFDFHEPISEHNPVRFKAEYKASPDSVFRFVEKCSKKSGFGDIENYALIISSHGFGFQEDSLLRDETSHTSASMQDLADNIAGLDKVFLGGRLRVLGFDSCVMNSIEVADELAQWLRLRRAVTDEGLRDVFLVSSEGFVPSAGWNYSRIIESFATDPNLSPFSMAKLLVDCYVDEYRPNVDFSGLSLDIAAFSLGALSSLVENIHVLGKQLLDLLDADSTGLPLAQIVLEAHSKCQTYLFDQCVDIKDFCDLLYRELVEREVVARDSGIAETLRTISGHFVSDAVYCRSLGTETQFSNGISLYFPWSFDTFLIILNRYRKLKFGKRDEDGDLLSGWAEFMWYYLWDTMRTADNYLNGTELLDSLLSEQAGGDIQSRIKEIVDAHSMSTEFFGEIGKTKINPPDKTRLNPPDNTRLNPPDKTRLAGLFIENFRRTHNFPWLPRPAFDKLMTGLDSEGARAPRRGSRRRK